MGASSDVSLVSIAILVGGGTGRVLPQARTMWKRTPACRLRHRAFELSFARSNAVPHTQMRQAVDAVEFSWKLAPAMATSAAAVLLVLVCGRLGDARR